MSATAEPGRDRGQSAATGHHADGSSPVVYFLVFGDLLLLTGLTVGVAYVDLGVLSDVVALTIAIGKALLVLLFFMHVWHSERLVWATILVAIAFMVLVLGGTLVDVINRAAGGA